MAETEAPDTTTNVLNVVEEIDGDQIPSRNYRFSIIGEPLPIKSDSDFTFDLDSLPSRPLAVSERLGLIFVAHSSGFSVARMKDVMDAAEELKNGAEGSCIQELSVVDVSLGKVSILALSADSSTLAASIGLNLYFFSVDGLINKDHEPSYSKSLDGSSYIKDMQWNPNLKDRYVVLTRDGNLYCGAGQGDLYHVMDNVDAVNWSMNGKFIAVAKSDFLSILSSKFEEKLRIKLLFDSLVDDDPNCVVKVDSVSWVRQDCIMLGCFCLSADGKEENNLIQFISVKDGKITNPSSSPVALTFRDAFLAINEDDIPSGSGPYTFISYLDEFELAFVANKKNTNQHIALFNWSEDGAAMIDIEVDSWVPTINLQVHNDDDNMILGLAINKDYKDEKTQLECGEIEKRVSPCCILMCVTVDGRFCMFHFASAVDPSASPEDLSSVSDEEEESPVLSSQHPVMNIVNSEKQIEDQDIQKVEIIDQKVEVNESSDTQQDVPTVKPNNDRDEGQSLLLQKKEGGFEAALNKASEPVNPLTQEVTPVNSASKSVNEKSNKSPFGASTELSINKSSFGSSGTFTSGPLFSSSVFGVQSSSSSGSFSSGGMFSSKSFDIKSLQSSHAAVQEKHGTSGSLFSSSGSGVQSSSSSGSFSSGGIFSSKSFDIKSLQSSHAAVQGKHGTSGSLFSTSVFGVQSSSSSGSFSSGGIFSSKSFDMKSLQSSHAAVQEKHGTSLGTTQFSSGLQSFSLSKMTSGPSTSSTLLPQGASTGAAFTKSLPVVSTFGSSTLSNLLPEGASTGAAFTKSLPVASIYGSSSSSNLLPQGVSTGAAFTKSLPLPVVSNAQPSPAKSFDFKFSDKGNHKNQTPSRLLNAESNLSEQHSVEEMAKELDALLDSIEEPGGFYDASVTAHKPSVAELEEGILALSDRCQKWTDKMHQGFEEVQLLLDKTVQVLARKIYIEAIVKQATDSQYLDIWNHQKLSSELDMKRRHILEINQNLTNQLIELERHLNTLELQRFGDRGDTLMNRKSSHMKHNPPRHVQSLHSLHNTMNAQLTAAEKLSECLSKQMAVLKIETEPVKKQNVKKELFDTIGISYDDTGFSSPGQETTRSIPSKSQHLISSYSAACKTDLKKSQQNAVKNFEPETARRHINSLDKSWASVEPPKTTVKRMLLQDDRQMSPARLSLPTATPKLNNRLYERSAVSHDIPHSANMSQIKGSLDVQLKQNSSLWGSYRSDSLSSGSQSTPIVTRDAAKDIHNLTAEKSNRLSFALKPDAVVVNDPKVSQQSKSYLEPSINAAGSPASNIFQKKPIQYPASGSKNTDGSQKPITTETSSIWSRKSLESSAVSSSSPSTAFSGKSFSLEASTRESQSSSASLSVPVTLAPSPFSFKDTSSSSTSAISVNKSSSGLGFKLSATQTTPVSGPSPSFPSFSSTTSSTKPTLNINLNTSKSEPTKLNPDTSESSKPQVASVANFDPKPNGTSGQTLPEPVVSTPSGPTSQPSPSILSISTLTSSTKPTLNIDLNTSKSEPSKLNPDTTESSKPQVLSVPNFDPKPNENSSGQTLPPQQVVSTPSGPTSQPSTGSISESQLNLNSKPEQPLVAPAVSSPVITSPVDVVSGQTNGSDPTVTQEDEMEEEAPDTTQFTLGNLGGFGLGSSPNPSAPKQNPFGAPFGNAPVSAPITSFTTLPSGGLFKPASFSVESQQPSQPPQQTSFGASPGIFGGNNNQSNGGQGFGQPARIGSGQQALGSVLGSFGQSRQFGAGLPGSTTSPSPFGGGFGGSQTAGGFATASSGGGGFASLASGGGGGFAAAATGSGGFAAAATGSGGFAATATGGGGFGAAATGGGGFGAAATGGGGFGAAATSTGGFGAAQAAGGGFGAAQAAGGGFGAAPSLGGGFGAASSLGSGFAGAPGAGGGFAGAASGGFGGFSSQGGSGFSTFGSSSGGTVKPQSELFTQMRK